MLYGRLSARTRARTFRIGCLRVLFGGLKFHAGGKVANSGFGSLVEVESFLGYSVVAAACCRIINKGVLGVLS